MELPRSVRFDDPQLWDGSAVESAGGSEMLKMGHGLCQFLPNDPDEHGTRRSGGGGGGCKEAHTVGPLKKAAFADFSVWAKCLKRPTRQSWKRGQPPVNTYTYRPSPTVEARLSCGCPPDRMAGGKGTLPFIVFTLNVGLDGIVYHVCGKEVCRVG